MDALLKGGPPADGKKKKINLLLKRPEQKNPLLVQNLSGRKDKAGKKGRQGREFYRAWYKTDDPLSWRDNYPAPSHNRWLLLSVPIRASRGVEVDGQRKNEKTPWGG